MRLRATLSVNFYCRPSKARSGEAPIELGVNVDGQRFFVNLPRKCKPKDLTKQRDYTTAIERRIRDYELWCLDRGKKITADGVREFIRNGWSIPSENVMYWVDEYLDYVEKKNICQSVKNKHRTVLLQFLDICKIGMEDGMDSITPGKIRTYGEYLNSNYKRSSMRSAGYRYAKPRGVPLWFPGVLLKDIMVGYEKKEENYPLLVWHHLL